MGVVWILIASLLFSIMGVFVRLGGAWFSPGELVFYRSLLSLLGMTLLLRWRGASIRTPMWRWHLSRGVSGGIALLCFFYALTHLPLGTAISLNYTSPLFLAFYLGVQQRQWPSWILIGALALGLIGVCLMLKPSFVGYSTLAVGVGLVSGVLAGFAYLAVRTLGEAGEPADRIVWYFSLTSLLIALLWVIATGWHFPAALSAWGVIFGLGVTATAAQFALTQAYRHGPTLVVGCLAYSTVLFSGIAEYLLGQSRFDQYLLLGQLLIVASGLIAVWSRGR